MRTKIILGILVVLTLFVSGCVESTVCGTYELDDSVLNLYQDNTYLYIPAGGIAQKGTYAQHGDSIEITNVLGMTTILNITRFGLVDDEGRLWRKKDVKFQNA